MGLLYWTFVSQEILPPRYYMELIDYKSHYMEEHKRLNLALFHSKCMINFAKFVLCKRKQHGKTWFTMVNECYIIHPLGYVASSKWVSIRLKWYHQVTHVELYENTYCGCTYKYTHTHTLI